MGTEGDRQTERGTQLAEECIARLEPIQGLTSKKMFGGVGLFQQGKMFGLISSDAELFFKVGDINRERYLTASATQHGKMPYFRVPESVLSTDSELIAWARDSIKVAHT